MDMQVNTRIYPVKAHNRVSSVMKLESGALRVTQVSGNTFDISQNDEQFQSFLIFMIINTEA